MKYIPFLFLLPSLAIANPIDSTCPQFVISGAPVGYTNELYLCKSNFAINYDIHAKLATYVAEHLTKQSLVPAVERTNDFHEDVSVPVQFRATLLDYQHQPYDRGHLSPAADNSFNEVAMRDSFNLSNIVPQVPANNRGIWKKLETEIRDYVNRDSDLYVVTGPYYQAPIKFIGSNNVPVPTHLWKVVVDINHKIGIAFFIPNKAISVKLLPNYSISIDQLETIIGIDFMPNLDKNSENLIENHKLLNLINTSN